MKRRRVGVACTSTHKECCATLDLVMFHDKPAFFPKRGFHIGALTRNNSKPLTAATRPLSLLIDWYLYPLRNITCDQVSSFTLERKSWRFLTRRRRGLGGKNRSLNRIVFVECSLNSPSGRQTRTAAIDARQETQFQRKRKPGGCGRNQDWFVNTHPDLPPGVKAASIWISCLINSIQESAARDMRLERSQDGEQEDACCHPKLEGQGKEELAQEHDGGHGTCQRQRELACYYVLGGSEAFWACKIVAQKLA